MPSWMVLNHWKGSIYSELSMILWEWLIRFITKEEILSAGYFSLTSALRLSFSPALPCNSPYFFPQHIYYVQNKLTNSLSLEEVFCLLVYFQKRLLWKEITLSFNCTASVSSFFFPTQFNLFTLKKKKPIKFKDLSA